MMSQLLKQAIHLAMGLGDRLLVQFETENIVILVVL